MKLPHVAALILMVVPALCAADVAMPPDLPWMLFMRPAEGDPVAAARVACSNPIGESAAPLTEIFAMRMDEVAALEDIRGMKEKSDRETALAGLLTHAAFAVSWASLEFEACSHRSVRNSWWLSMVRKNSSRTRGVPGLRKSRQAMSSSDEGSRVRNRVKA